MSVWIFTDTSTLRQRLLLLIGQSFAMGFSLALGFAIANGLFLDEFGAPVLPYTYLVLAVLGAAVSFGFAALQRRFTLPQLSLATIGAFTLFFLLAWFGLTRTLLSGISFALIVVVPLLIQVGFIVLGSQAGRLLDVRQIKQYFPWVVTGFVGGFLIGGLALPSLLALTGGTENLLLVVTLFCGLFFLLIGISARRFPSELSGVAVSNHRQPGRSLLQILSSRFVLLVVAYQMLATVVNYLSDYILLTQTGSRFATAAEITTFFGRFSAWLNAVDLLFLILVAGFFLRRFGLRAGLMTNPLVLVLFYLGMAAVGVATGPATTLFFGLAVVARIANIVLTDGTTRGSLNAAYQAVPPQDRVAVQTGVEGIGAPVAVGVVGLILLLLNAISGVTIVHVVVLTLMAAAAWGVLALLVYRGYAGALLHTLRRRVLGAAELELVDETSLAVVESLLRSDSVRDVVLGLDMLETAAHPAYTDYLLPLAVAQQPDVRAEALTRIARLRPPAALPLVETAVQTETSTAPQAAAIEALCALQGADALAVVAPYLDSATPRVRRAALAGLLRDGGIPGALAAGNRIEMLYRSPAPLDRVLAARVIGDVGVQNFYQPLVALLQDDAVTVRQAALVAAGQVRHPDLLPLILPNLSDARTRALAAEALQAYGDVVLPHVETGLRETAVYGPNEVERLVRLAGQLRNEQAVRVLQPHIGHPNRDVREQVLLALYLCGYRAGGPDMENVQAQLRHEAEQAAHLLVARRDLGQNDWLIPLLRGLDETLAQTQRRLFLLLSFVHDPRGMLRAGEQLSRGSSSQQALTMELLDVTLRPEEKALIFPLVDPRLTLEQRVQAFGRRFTLAAMGREARLQKLIETPERPWLQACAIYAAGMLNLSTCAPAVQHALTSPDPIVQETARWTVQRVS